MKRTIERLIVCTQCKGPGFIDVYDRITEEVNPEKCSSCNGIGILLQSTTIVTRAITSEEMTKKRERKNKQIILLWT